MSRLVFYNSGRDNERGAWDFRFWSFFRSVFGFCTENLFVVRSDSGFFGAKIKQVRFLCGSLCSQMLGYFTCFYFTVNAGQTAMWDSVFLIDIYSYRRAFYKRKISPIVLYCDSIEDLCEFAWTTVG